MTDRDRTTLALLGLVALATLGATRWRERQEAATPAPAQTAAWDAALRHAREVDVNTAGIAELERLPQVGPALAQRIVADRVAHGPFRTPQDLTRVPGLGPKTYDAVEPYVTVE